MPLVGLVVLCFFNGWLCAKLDKHGNSVYCFVLAWCVFSGWLYGFLTKSFWSAI